MNNEQPNKLDHLLQVVNQEYQEQISRNNEKIMQQGIQLAALKKYNNMLLKSQEEVIKTQQNQIQNYKLQNLILEKQNYSVCDQMETGEVGMTDEAKSPLQPKKPTSLGLQPVVLEGTPFLSNNICNSPSSTSTSQKSSPFRLQSPKVSPVTPYRHHPYRNPSTPKSSLTSNSNTTSLGYSTDASLSPITPVRNEDVESMSSGFIDPSIEAMVDEHFEKSLGEQWHQVKNKVKRSTSFTHSKLASRPTTLDGLKSDKGKFKIVSKTGPASYNLSQKSFLITPEFLSPSLNDKMTSLNFSPLQEVQGQYKSFHEKQLSNTSTIKEEGSPQIDVETVPYIRKSSDDRN